MESERTSKTKVLVLEWDKNNDQALLDYEEMNVLEKRDKTSDLEGDEDQ